jgi:hemerythrin superfamily protein
MTRKNRNILYNVGAAAGGITAGIFISRLLPPVVAQISGSMRSRLGRDPFERLIEDHRKIRSLVNEMVQTPEGHLGRRTKLFLNLKRTLAKHAMAEEDVVYPLLHGPMHEAQQSKHLYDEHADLKIHLYELEHLLMENANWSERAFSLRDLLERHIREEEEIQFPKMRQFLDKRRTRQVSGEIRREEALVL